MTFKQLLAEAVERYGSQSRAAAAIGMDRTRFGRVQIQLERPDGDTTTPSFEVVNCLKLARALGRSPSQVLRAAGKQEEAELIEKLYGESSAAPLTTDEQSLLQVYRSHRNGTLGEAHPSWLKIIRRIYPIR